MEPVEVEHDGEVMNLYDSMDIAGGGDESGRHYLDLDSYTEMQKNESNQTHDEPQEREVSSPKKKSLFNCLVCGKRFNQNAGRYNHMKKIHNIFRGDKTNIRCLEKGCLFRCSYKEKLQLHLVEEHGFNMDIRIKSFDSYSEFLRWKEEFEKQEKTRFVKKSGSRSREKGVRVVYFYCSRSGTNLPQHTSEKQLHKRKQSTKSSHHCTASITCLELTSGHVEVKVCNTHYGHDADLQQLRLTYTDKIHIVEQLIKGVPRDVVLDNIRSSASSEVDRIHLITIKDIKNIEKAYRLRSKNSNDMSSSVTCNISSWVTLMNESESTPVVHFEEHGSIDLVNYDFTLVIMTLGQTEMAKKYGQSRIFYIPTYATNDNKYFVYSQKAKNTHEIHIATLIVVDSSNDALPIAFMISTKFSLDQYKLFFECVKKKVPELDAKAVLTDDDNDIYEAWVSVFKSDSDEKPCHLWSNRFVDKDWRDNLITIPNEEVQESIYEKLYSYLESPDDTGITSTLKDYVDNELLTKPLTVQFGNHFALKYLGSEPLWAGCYGKRSVAINAQLNMERLSNEVEEVVDRKHLDKRLIVRTVQDLLKLISDKQCQRQAKVQKQINELPNHHKLGLRISREAIFQASPTSWRVNSSKDPENIYAIVTQQEERCYNSERCMLFCTKCHTCAHEFKCSCKLYAFDKSMCKHIHAVVATFFEESHFLAIPETEGNSEAAEKEVDQLKQDCFWGRRRKRKAALPVELTPVKDENLLPVLDEMIHNKKRKVMKEKRGRPRKNKDPENIKKESDQSNEEAEKPHRSKVNILKKSKKTQPLKKKITSSPGKKK